MQTFAPISKAPQKAEPASSTTLSQASFGHSPGPKSVLHLQRMIGNRAVQRLLQARPRTPLRGQSGPLIQREVRINGGAARVNEADYQAGGSKSNVGSRHSVATLIADNVRRVFDSVAELEGYANGQTDYIGDVVTSSAGTYWYRLPENQLTVLGELHKNPQGNVPDVILGLQTSRFLYEPFNELAGVAALNSPFSGTRARLAQIHSGRRVAGLVDRKHPRNRWFRPAQ